MTPTELRAAFHRAFPGYDFERSLERLELLVGRFVRMGDFADTPIAMAPTVDYGGGKTSIDDRDFALVAFFAGVGRLVFAGDVAIKPTGMQRLAAEKALTGDVVVTANYIRESFPNLDPNASPDDRGAVYSDTVIGESQEPLASSSFKLTVVDASGTDITDDCKIGALEAIVSAVGPTLEGAESRAATADLLSRQIAAKLALWIDCTPRQITIAFVAPWSVRIEVDDELKRLMVGA